MSTHTFLLDIRASRTAHVVVEIPDGLAENVIDDLIDGAVDRFLNHVLDAGDLTIDDAHPRLRARDLIANGYRVGGGAQ